LSLAHAHTPRTHARTHAHTYTHARARHTRTHTYVRTHTHARTHAHTHTHTHTHTHKHIHREVCHCATTRPPPPPPTHKRIHREVCHCATYTSSTCSSTRCQHSKRCHTTAQHVWPWSANYPTVLLPPRGHVLAQFTVAFSLMALTESARIGNLWSSTLSHE
jgi:hypothetical protein